MGSLLVTIADDKTLLAAKTLIASAITYGHWSDDKMLIMCGVDCTDIIDLNWFIQNDVIIKHCGNSFFSGDFDNHCNSWWSEYVLPDNCCQSCTNCGSKKDCLTQYSRLLIFKEEFKQWDAVLFIDSSAIVTNSLMSLKNLETGIYAAKESENFITNVIWFDPNFAIKETTFGELLTKIYNNVNYSISDEPIINEQFCGQIKELPYNYNIQLHNAINNGYPVRRLLNGNIITFKFMPDAAETYFCEISRAAISGVETKTRIQKSTYECDNVNERNLVPVTIRDGDSLWQLFGNDWTHVYNEESNVSFRQKSPNPNLIFEGSQILSSPLLIADRSVIEQDFVITPGDFITQMFDKNQTLVGAEVGCFYGNTAYALLSYFTNLKLYIIDPWSQKVNTENATEYLTSLAINDPYGKVYNHLADWESIYQTVVKKIEFAADRAIVLRRVSNEACLKVSDCELDFVFIDADHSYNSVKQDLINWYPKVREGGIVSGHDYNFLSVKLAVDEFASTVKKSVFKTMETSWYFLK